MIRSLFHFIYDQVAHSNNQFLQGGLVLGFIGAIIAYARSLPMQAIRWIESRFIITLDITNEDPSFFWLAGWLSMQPYSRRARNLSVTTYRDSYGNLRKRSGNQSTSCEAMPISFSDRPQLPEIILTPAPGHHFFFFRRRPIWLVRNRESGTKQDGLQSFFTKESFQIRIIARKQETARALIEEARQLSIIEREVKTDIYVYSGYDGFRRVYGCDHRPIHSVFLPEGQSEHVVADVKGFLEQREWYQSRGIPWRRGYLLYGLAGSGKTTLIRALASDLQMDLYIVSLASGMDDQRFLYSLSSVPPRSMILIEDAGTVFEQRKKNESVDNNLSFSGVLNALDGAASREGWLIFMTTNHKEKLDPALIRPGRADYHLEFTYADAYQGRSIFAAFFPEADGAERFGVIVEDRQMTMAEVQQHLIFHQKSAVDALASLSLPDKMAVAAGVR